MHIRTAPAVLVSIVLPFLGAGCSPASPTSLSGEVFVVGPESLQPGASVQYRATERLSDGSTRPVTDVRWSSSAPNVLQIDSTGLATGRAVGESVVTAEVTDRRGIQSVLVLSAGTYRLYGTILDATSGDPVPGARLEVSVDANGSLPPIAVSTAGPDGKYSLYGVPALSDIRVTQDGYLPTTTRVELASHNGRNFSIVWDTAAYPDFTGAYTLTIEADDACPSAPSPLPPDLRRRIFPARMQQVGNRLTVEINTVHVDSVFAGHATASGATFWLKEGEDNSGLSKMDLAESIPSKGQDANPVLGFLGTATTNRSATGLLGSLDGTIIYHLVEPPLGLRVPTASCRAGRFELTRQ